MLTIKTILKTSKVQGFGLFADEDISKGTITWKFDPRFDIVFSPKEVKKMSKNQHDLIRQYAYLSKISGNYIYSIDDSRFTNHSSLKNNIDLIDKSSDSKSYSIANRNIQKGEEILVNYRELDAIDEKSLKNYLNS